MSDVFISYSRLDKDFVGQLRDALIAQTQEVWIDWESIPPSQTWWSEIQKGIARANNFVVILSPNSVSSPICQMEIEYARQLGKRVIPVLYQDYSREEAIKSVALRLATPDQDAVRELWGTRQPHSVFDGNEAVLKHINYFFFRHDDDFEARFNALFEIIRTDYTHKEQHTTLELRALEWMRRERNPSFLLLEDELKLAQLWLEAASGKAPSPTELQRAYIQASDHRTRQLRSIRRTSIVGSLAAVMAIIVALVAIFASTQANASAEAARLEVQTANRTLTPIMTTLDAAAIAQINAENRAASAATQVARANSDLTAIPPTLTQLADQITVAETSVASLQLASDALSLISDLRVGQDRQTAYIEVNGPVDIVSPYNSISALGFTCRLWSEALGFQVYLRESPQGAVMLDFQAGNLTVTQLNGDNTTIAEVVAPNAYSRGLWINLSVLLIDHRLVVFTNDRLRLDQTFVGLPSTGSIRISARSSDVFRLGRNCIDMLMNETIASSVEQVAQDIGVDIAPP